MPISAGSINSPNFNNFQQEIILQAPVPIFVVEGAEFIIIISNEKNLDKWQRTQKEVMGKPLFEVFPEGKSQPFYEFLSDVYQKGIGIKRSEVKAEFYRNGILDTAWFDIHYEPIKNDKGQVYAIMAISVEITEQVLARKRAENSEKELQQMADAMPHFVWVADKQGKVIFYNKRIYEYCGLDRDTDKDYLWNSMIHPDDLENTLKTWQKSVSQKTLYSIQHRLRMKSGLYRWFLSRAFFEEDFENKTSKWFGSATDIHEQKQNELKIKETEQFNRTVLESNPDRLTVIDKQGRIQYMNVNGQRLMEIDDFKKVKNKLWWELWSEENKDFVRKSIKKALSGENVQFIAQDLTAKGNLKWWDVVVSPVNNPDGEVKEILSISRDITHQKLVEEKVIKDREIFERTLLNIPSAIYHFDNKGNIVYANELAAYQMGYHNAEELLAEKDFTQFRKTVDERFELFDGKGNAIPSNRGSALITINSGKPSELVVKFVNRKTKDSFWLLNRSVPLTDDEGNLTNVFTSCTDISEQKFAEEDVQKSESRYRRIFENTPVSIWEEDFSHLKQRIDQLSQQGIVDFDAYFKIHHDQLIELIDSVVVKDVNTTSLKLYDCSKEEILQGLRQFYTNETLPAFVNGFKIIAQGGGHYESESIVKNKAGELINLMVFIDFPSNEDDYSSVQVIRFDITERKKTDEALKYRKALLEAQNEAIPDAILIIDSNGEMLSMNKNFAKIWGMPEDIIANKDDNAALQYAMSIVMDPEGFIERVRYCYAHPEIKAHDEILLKDGRILDRYGNAVVGEDGTNYGWAWYFRDITEQKKSNEIIRESEEKYRGLFEKMEQGFCIIEVIFDEENNPIDYRFVESNPTFKHQTVLSDVDGKTISELVPDIEISWSQVYGKVVLTGESTRFIDYSQAMNTWFEVYAFRLGDKTNNKVAILFTNITERKKAELEIKASEEKLRLLTETIPQLVWMTDEIGNTEYLSSQWEKYAGEMPMSEYWTRICHPDDSITSLNAWQKSISTGNKYVSEIRLKNKEGEYRWHVSVGVPLKNDKDEIIKWIGSVSDIHDRKLEEQKKDEFISIASHEMKTPLTSAKAYLQLMEITLNENDEAYLYTKKASDAVERLNKLISELLDASKIQHGKLNYTNSAFDFDTMVVDTIENVQYSSITHKIVKKGAIKKQFLGDKDRLQQVIINLLTNAIKYSPHANEVTVEVQEENNFLQVSVIDNGIGMPEKHLERVFERYYRVEEHSVQFQGLGIGLYISYDIIKRHDGKMWVESNLGEGSRFHFTLPFVN
jgi:PAS domain S-box-containing protein